MPVKGLLVHSMTSRWTSASHRVHPQRTRGCILARRNSGCWSSSCSIRKAGVFAREELLDAVWGPDIHVEPRTVDVHIRRLRKSINGEGELDIVRTVRAAGYALDTEPV